ncbi:fatty-acid synthase [Chloroflexi bacterium TSY]|nr:fatty-acid synthase [Chloroflexi bacterium TSY]
MAAKDIYHDHVRTALIDDGWTITHDYLRMSIGKKDLYVDLEPIRRVVVSPGSHSGENTSSQNFSDKHLGAERLIAAEKGKQKIAIEVKSFVGKSSVEDLEKALGQFVLYEDILSEQDPDRTLYLAIRYTVYRDLFEEPIGQIRLKNKRLRLVIFAPETKEIVEWIE